MGALHDCLHMTARCPHYRAECNESASKQCHYVKKTTASMIAVAASLRAYGVARLPSATLEYLKETETFLEKIKIPLENKKE